MNSGPRPVLLMIRELNLGGTERQLTEIAKAFDRTRFQPHVGCFRPTGPHAEELAAAGVPVVQFPVHSFTSPKVLLAARDMGRYLREHGIELVHTFDTPANLFGVFTARAYRTPVIISSQRAYRDLTSRFHRYLARLTDRIVDAVVVNCHAVERHLIADEGVPAHLIHVCYNSIDTERFHPRERWCPSELTDASLVIGVACELRPEKDLVTLIDAFAQIRECRPGLRLLIIGDGPSEAALKAHCRERGVEGQCRFVPRVVDMERWLPLFDIFVLPSLSEALSNSLLEAMASGCAVVASEVGGNPELVSPGETGLLFPAGDTAALASCLQDLIEDLGLRRQLAEAGMLFVREEFSWRAPVAKLEDLYDRLLSQHSPKDRPSVVK